MIILLISSDKRKADAAVPVAASNKQKDLISVPHVSPSISHSVSSVGSNTAEHTGSVPVSSGHVKALINTFQNKESTPLFRTSSSHSLSSNSNYRSLHTYHTPESSMHNYIDNSDIRSRIARETLMREFDDETIAMADFNAIDHNSLDLRTSRSYMNSPLHFGDTQRYVSHHRDSSPAAKSTSSQSHDSHILSIAAIAAEKPLKTHRSKVSISSNGSEFVDVVVDHSTSNMAGMADYNALELGIRLSLEQVCTYAFNWAIR